MPFRLEPGSFSSTPCFLSALHANTIPRGLYPDVFIPKPFHPRPMRLPEKQHQSEKPPVSEHGNEIPDLIFSESIEEACGQTGADSRKRQALVPFLLFAGFILSVMVLIMAISAPYCSRIINPFYSHPATYAAMLLLMAAYGLCLWLGRFHLPICWPAYLYDRLVLSKADSETLHPVRNVLSFCFCVGAVSYFLSIFLVSFVNCRFDKSLSVAHTVEIKGVSTASHKGKTYAHYAEVEPISGLRGNRIPIPDAVYREIDEMINRKAYLPILVKEGFLRYQWVSQWGELQSVPNTNRRASHYQETPN